MNKIGKTIKRIAALAGGALMVGATIAGAFAAVNVADLPAPFVTSAGVFDGFVVVGSMGWNPDLAYNAAAVQGLANDVAVGIDVGGAFVQRASIAAGTDGTGTTYAGGVQFQTPGNKLVLQEDPATIKAAFTSSDFSWLAGGTYQTNAGKSGQYKEYINMGLAQAQVKYVKPTIGGATEPNLYLDILAQAGANYLYTYKAIFNTPITWTLTDDFKSSTIKLLGDDWLINDYDSTACTWISLMGGKYKYPVSTDADVTATIEGKTYTIKLASVASESPTAASYTCTFDINGETVQLKKGQTTKLSDGTTVGATACLQGKAGVADAATLFFGAKTVKITNGGSVEVGDTALAGSLGTFTSTCGATDDMSVIGFSYSPNDETYKIAGAELEDPVTGLFSFVYTGLTPDLTSTAREQITTTTSGSNNVVASFKTLGGAISTEIFYDDGAAASGCGRWDGTAAHTLWNSETLAGAAGIMKQDTFVTSKKPYSHVMQYSSIDNVNKILTVIDKASGSSIQQAYAINTGVVAACPAGTGEVGDGYATMVLDGNNHAICVDIDGDVAVNGIFVDQDGDGAWTTANVPLYTDKGARITLTCPAGATTNPGTVTLAEEKDKVGADYANSIAWQYAYVAGTTNKETLSSNPAFSDGSVFSTVGTSTTNKGMDHYGTHVTYDTTSYQVITNYPDYYATADVWLVPKGSSAAAGTTTGAVKMNYFSGANGIAKVDTDYATPAKPVILIGGPGVNQLVKNLADAGKTTAAADYAADTAIIQMVENAFGENEALIVAGYAAKDTQLAGRVLAAYLLQGQNADKMTGDKVTLGTAGASTVSGVTFK